MCEKQFENKNPKKDLKHDLVLNIYNNNAAEIRLLEDFVFRLIKYYFVVFISMVTVFAIETAGGIDLWTYSITMLGLNTFLFISSYMVCVNILSIVHIELRNLKIEQTVGLDSLGTEHEAFLVNEEQQNLRSHSNSLILRWMESIVGKDSNAYQTYLFMTVVTSVGTNLFIFLITLLWFGKLLFEGTSLDLLPIILISISIAAIWATSTYYAQKLILRAYFRDITILPYEKLMQSIGWKVEYKTNYHPNDTEEIE